MGAGAVETRERRLRANIAIEERIFTSGFFNELFESRVKACIRQATSTNAEAAGEI